MANSFKALQFSDSGGWVPPDTTLGAGAGYVFEAINLEGAVYNTTSGNSLVNKFSLSSFFGTTASLSDPRVIFDPISQRWFVQIITIGSGQTSGSWMLAVSTSSSPTTFKVYNFPTSNGFPDFPKMGLNGDKVVITGDAFSGNSFLGTEFIVINKSDLVNGAATAHYQFFGPNEGAFAIEPAQHMSPLNANNDLFMAAVAYASASSVNLWSVSGVPSSSTSASIATKSLAIKALNSPPNAVQPGNSTVATNDQALLDAVFRDGSPGELWVAASSACTPSGDSTTRSCLRFIEVSISNGDLSTAAVAQDFDFGSAGQYYYYPALRTDKDGNMAAVFTASSSSIYPSVWCGGQLTSEAGTFGHLKQIIAGTSAYTQANRWGDYSGASVAADDLTIYLGGEYSYPQSVSSVYGTAVGAVVPSASGF